MAESGGAELGSDKLTHETPVFVLEEYREAGLMHRLHITLIFGQTTIFLAAFGLVAQLLFGAADLPSIRIRLLAGVGALVTFVLLVQHQRQYRYSEQSRARAIDIQNRLDKDGLGPYGESPLDRWLPVSAGNAARGLYLVALAGWALLLATGRLP